MPRTSILYWEARRRLELLTALRRDIEAYYHRATWTFGGWQEDAEAKRLRREINEQMRDAAIAMRFVGVPGTIYYSPPPAVGGLAGDINLLDNVFHLPRFGLPHDSLIDELDRAIGIYRSWIGPLWRCLFNPFYWIGRGLGWVADLPFRLARSAGFETKKAEESTWGKLVKMLIQGFTALATGLATVLGILEKLGWLDVVRDAITHLLG